jgi:DNA helicase HerA-like ATPase
MEAGAPALGTCCGRRVRRATPAWRKPAVHRHRSEGRRTIGRVIDIPAGHLFLGEHLDPETRMRNGEPVLLEAADLATHGVIVGMTGSGKTGLGVVLIEEALLAGIPTLIIDPKGDLGNLLLAFPELKPDDFAPWVEGGDPADVAKQWSEGLADWGIEPSRIAQLREAA